jgi:hypothetical protein
MKSGARRKLCSLRGVTVVLKTQVFFAQVPFIHDQPTIRREAGRASSRQNGESVSAAVGGNFHLRQRHQKNVCSTHRIRPVRAPIDINGRINTTEPPR